MQIPSHVLKAARRLSDKGFQAYLAGGCVRDLQLGCTPKDYDLATSATPSEVTALFPRSQAVGAHFGVVVVPTSEDPIEIATFRTDGSYSDGRRPDSVTFASAEEDAMRRDFTLNGMFMDPQSGEILDWVGGMDDLRERRLRAIGDPEARFAEDHLRLLRALRFAARFDLTIDPATWNAILNQSHSVSKVAVERVRDEFNRMLAAPTRLQAFDLLMASGLMNEIVPEIVNLQGCEQPPEFHPEGDVFTHTRMMLGLLEPDAPLALVLSVLFHDIAKPATQTRDEDTGRIRFNGHDTLGAEMTEGILRRLKYPTETLTAVAEAVACHMRFIHVQQMRTAKLKRFMARSGFENELELHRVDCLGSNGRLDNHRFLLEKQEQFAQAPLIPPKLLSGHDLMSRGWPGGPELGQLLKTLQDLQLEGELETPEAALLWVENHASTPAAFQQWLSSRTENAS